MKQLLKLFVASILSVSLIGCSMMSPKPSSVVEDQIIEFKKKDSNTITETFEEGMDEELIQTFYKRVMDFDYEIVDERIKGDKASVTVKIKTYAFGEAFANAFGDLFSMALVGAEEQELTQFMFETFNGVKEKDYRKKVKIKCTKKDGNWEPENLEDNEEFADAILGGFQTIVQQLDESLADDSQ